MASPSVHFLVVIFFTISSPLTDGAHESLEAACKGTRHRALCMHSLASFSHSTAARQQKNPWWWARAGVSVTLAEAKRVGRYVAKMKHGEMVRGRKARRAVADCVECFGNAVAELHSSLGELQRLESGMFEYRMSNVETWVSAALTDLDTCLDGFGGYKGEEVAEMKSKVLNAIYFTSNALALVNKLASSKRF